MKDIKCPLCGGKPEYILDEGDGHCEYAGCPKCGLYAAPSWGDWNCSPNEEDTWQRWRDLVSKFPPIMRLNQGDNVLVHFDYDIYTVINTYVPSGAIYLQDVYGDVHTCDVNAIKKWPWELEQKGGAEQ